MPRPATHAHLPRPRSEVTKALQEAERICTNGALRLTPLRRDVFALLLAEKRPVSAYVLLAALEQQLARKLAPLTVYRALDFLVDAGLAHRLERSHSFVACQHPAARHNSLYLVCSTCGLAEEVDSAVVNAALSRESRKHGFKVELQVVELRGMCQQCTPRDTG